MERQERLTRPGTLLTFQTCCTFPTFLNVCPDCQAHILADVPGKLSLFGTEVVTLCLKNWFFFDRRKNDLLNQEIRIFRVLDEFFSH